MAEFPFFLISEPHIYHNSAHYCWTLTTATDGEVVRASVEALDLEPLYDHVDLYDGATSRHRLLASLSGTVKEMFVYYATSNVMHVVLTTDSSRLNRGGFALHFESMAGFSSASPASDAAHHVAVRSTFDRLELSSPGYAAGRNYAAGQRLTWLIEAAVKHDGFAVKLTVGDFCTENLYDYLFIYDGASAVPDALLAQLTYVHAEEEALAFHSSGPALFLVFNSDASVSCRGFRLWHQLTVNHAAGYLAGGQALAATGVDARVSISSPFTSLVLTGRPVEFEVTCRWVAKSEPGLNFRYGLRGKLQPRDRLSLVDGLYSSGERLPQSQCTQRASCSFVSQSGYVEIVYTSSGEENTPFVLTYNFSR